MPSFLTRQRVYIWEDPNSPIKTFDELEYPVLLKLEAELGPKELFGPSEVITPRATLTLGSPTEMTINGETGRMSSRSDVFLPPAFLVKDWGTLKGRKMNVLGNKVTYSIAVSNSAEVHAAIDFLVSTITSSLSITFGIFVDVLSLRGEISDQRRFVAVISGDNYFARFVTLELNSRDDKIAQAIDLQKPWIASYPRFLTSAIYFQHALRLVSPHETVSSPHHYFAEVLVNLCKCLELLLADRAIEGKTNDKIRAKCRLIGYSDQQIESQVTPILLLRSEFDGAHPLGAKVPAEQVVVVKEFISRSIDNVQTILMTVAEYIKSHETFLTPIHNEVGADLKKLVTRVIAYVQAEKLPTPSYVSKRNVQS